MARGPKRHQKLINAPSSWMLSKMSGVYTYKCGAGPHQAAHSIPLAIILRNVLKLSQNYNETKAILAQGAILIDGKVCKNANYPIGIMDVISIPSMKTYYRVICDVKGRFKLVAISKNEASYKLIKVSKTMTGAKKIPVLVSHDGRTIKHTIAGLKCADTIRYDLNDRKILGVSSFKVGAPVLAWAGNNKGRIGHVLSENKIMGKDSYVKCVDSRGNEFITVKNYLIVIGEGQKLWTSIPAGNGLRHSNIELLETNGKHEIGLRGIRSEYVHMETETQ